jgi:hypothetical protein
MSLGSFMFFYDVLRSIKSGKVIDIQKATKYIKNGFAPERL